MEALQAAGAAAVVVHGRTMEQRYKKPSDWNLVADASRDYAVPIIGNGDILTHYDVSPPSPPSQRIDPLQFRKLCRIDAFTGPLCFFWGLGGRHLATTFG